MLFKSYGQYKKWLEKSDVWQLQALRAEKLSKRWSQYDKILNKSYDSYEDLCSQIEVVIADLERFKQFEAYEKLQSEAIGG